MIKRLALTVISLAALTVSIYAADSTKVAADSLAFDRITADTTAADTAVYELSIGRLLVDNMQLNDTLLLTLNTHGRELGAFDLKIAVDNPIVDILDILPGELQDSCRWEYFNARRMETTGRENFPAELWQVVALAETASGPTHPACYSLDGDIVLLRIVLSNAHALQTPDQKVPIYFFWEDCTDNAISGRSGYSLLMSRHVYDYFGDSPGDDSRLFPSRIGAPTECIKTNVSNPMRRMIDFHNGGVEFKLNLEAIDSAAIPIEK